MRSGQRIILHPLSRLAIDAKKQKFYDRFFSEMPLGKKKKNYKANSKRLKTYSCGYLSKLSTKTDELERNFEAPLMCKPSSVSELYIFEEPHIVQRYLPKLYNEET